MAPPAASLACACCGKEPEAGRKFASCELCVTRKLPTTRYCSEACQAQHWKDGGHKKWHAAIDKEQKMREKAGIVQCISDTADFRARKAERTGSEYDRVCAEGGAHLANNHLRYAERSFRRCIELEPENAAAYFNMGYVRVRSCDYVGAAKLYLQGSELCQFDSPMWACCIASAFNVLDTDVCAEVPKPEWWNDDALKELSARVLAAAPDSPVAMVMRAQVLGGIGTWEAGHRTVAEIREAARQWRRASELHPYADEGERLRGYAAELDKLAGAMEMEAAAELKEKEEQAAAELRVKEAKANAAADALLAEEEAEKAAAARSGGKGNNKAKGKAKHKPSKKGKQ